MRENKAIKRMWPSFETASSLYDFFNVVLLCAAASGVIATGIVIWMGNVKELYLRKDLSDARLLTEQLKVKYAWRRIDPTKYAKLVADLRPMATLIGVSSFVDPESSSYADDIAGALSDAGFNVRRQYSVSTPTYDLILSWPSNTATALRVALKHADIPIEFGQANCGRPNMPDNKSRWDETLPLICVGLKPRPSP